MSRLMTIGNIALFEYPEIDTPKFDLNNDGILFIFGYNISFGSTTVGSAKRFETGLKDYSVIGKYYEAKDKFNVDLDAKMFKVSLDKNNTVILMKKDDYIVTHD